MTAPGGARGIYWPQLTGPLALAPGEYAARLTATHRPMRTVLTVTAWDGRELRAFFDPRTDAPFLESEDAPADLRTALERAWRQKPPRGRHPGTVVDEAGGADELGRLADELRRNHRRVTLDTMAAASGTFTRDNLRYWLRSNRRRLRDF